MIVKMGVWPRGQADPDRYVNSDTLEKFICHLKELKSGDQALILVSEDHEKLNFKEEIELHIGDEWSLGWQMYNALRTLILPYLTEEQRNRVDELLDDIINKNLVEL